MPLDHRIRLDDNELLLITAALRSRQAMTTGARRARILRLLCRLEDVAAGNPRLRFSGTDAYPAASQRGTANE